MEKPMSKREVQKNKKKKLYLCVIGSIFESGKLPDIGKKQRRQHLLNDLKTNNIIYKKGYGTWALTKLGEQIWTNKEVQKSNLGTLVQPTPFKKKKSTI